MVGLRRAGSMGLCLVLAGWKAGTVHAQDFANYRLTGVDGYAVTRFVTDSQSTQQTVATGLGNERVRSAQGSSGWRTEVFMNTHGYVFHPNFITLDIGGGPVFDHQRMTTDSSGQMSASTTLFNFTGRASVLKGKPISGNLFFDHLNPTMTIAPGEVMTQESTRAGFDVGATSAISPIPVRVAFSTSHVVGRGMTRTVDDTVDQLSLQASRAYGALGATQMQYQHTAQNSLSGSLALPIQASTSQTQGFNLDTRLQLGSARQHDLAHLFSANSRQYSLGGSALPAQRDMNTVLDLRSRVAGGLTTFATGQYASSDQGTLSSVTQMMAGGLSWLPNERWEGGLGLRSERNQTREMSINTQALDGNLRYRQELFAGLFQGSYGLHYDQRDQQAAAASAAVLGETLDIATAPLSLARQHVVAGSIRVLNPTRTQTYVEGLDYRITVVGYETRLERTAGTSIPLNEQVLVDYSYDTGGTYGTTQLDHTMGLNWGVSRYFNAFYRRFDSTPRLTSGTSTFLLNTVQSDMYGMRGEVPFRFIVPMTVGGSMEREERLETVAPYRREAQDVFVQTDESFFGLGNYRLSARKLRVQYQTPGNDVNLTGYDLRSWSRQWFNIDLSMVTSYERDDGGLLPRRRMDNTVSAQWRERKLSINLSYIASRENQGDFRRDRQMLNIMLRRDF